MSFGTGAGKGDLPRAVNGEAYRTTYDSIKKPEPLDALLAKLDAAVNENNTPLVECLHVQIKAHPYYRGNLENVFREQKEVTYAELLKIHDEAIEEGKFDKAAEYKQKIDTLNANTIQ